jgi:nicotinamidase-related amidase
MVMDLTRSTIALAIALQPGLIYGVRDIDSMQLVSNVVSLARGAKGLGVPIVATSATGGPFGSTIPELKAQLPDNSVITRSVVSAWDDPRVVEAIRRTGRKNIIIAGTSTDVCLTFPALGALADGYNVYAVMDASGTWNANLQNITLARLTQAGVIPTNTSAVLVDMLKDNNSPKAAVVYGSLSNSMPAVHFMNQVAPSH